MADDGEEDSKYIIESIDAPEDEPTWNATVINIFLDECLLKKRDLHNSHYGTSKFFEVIREKMLERGFNFSVNTLENKFQNFKKYFHTISRSNEVHTARAVIGPHYDKMVSIFAEDLDRVDAPTTLSLETNRTGESDVGQYLVEDDVFGGTETEWCHEAVIAFLGECSKRKYDLWDPQVRRRKIFTEIRRELTIKGYNFFQETLDRKLRNMKKHFHVVTEASVNGKKKQITWPYYNWLKEIYGGNMAKEMRRLKMKAPEDHLQGVQRISPEQVLDSIAEPVASCSRLSGERCHSAFDATSDLDLSTTLTQKSANLSSGNYPNGNYPGYDVPMGSTIGQGRHNSDRGHRIETSNEEFLARILALEKRRTITAEELLHELKEANRISRKRLEFQKLKFEYLMKRKKSSKDNAYS